MRSDPETQSTSLFIGYSRLNKVCKDSLTARVGINPIAQRAPSKLCSSLLTICMPTLRLAAVSGRLSTVRHAPYDGEPCFLLQVIDTKD